MSDIPSELEPSWSIAGTKWHFAKRPKLMGILNVTPDSFSDGGRHASVEAAVAHGVRLEQDGADVLDVGGESTRPGAIPVPADEELRRVIPVIEQLVGRVGCPISIDTYKAPVARAALQAGAYIVNDISGATFDPGMVGVCRDSTAGLVLMHIQGTPQTMQHAPRYTSVVDEILAYFERRLRELESEGIARERVVLDPGIGFGKTAAHNLEILRNISRFGGLGRPVCIGHSRKRFLKTLLGKPLDEHSAGTIGVSLALADQGVDMLRVHDVGAVRDALVAWNAVRGMRDEG